MGYQSISLSFCCYNGVQSQILEIIALVPLLYTTIMNLLSFFQLRTISARLSRCTITRQGAPLWPSRCTITPILMVKL
jgi:hypothetical protein